MRFVSSSLFIPVGLLLSSQLWAGIEKINDQELLNFLKHSPNSYSSLRSKSVLRQKSAVTTRAYDPLIPDVFYEELWEPEEGRFSGQLRLSATVTKGLREVQEIRIAKINERIATQDIVGSAFDTKEQIIKDYYALLFEQTRLGVLKEHIAFLSDVLVRVNKLVRAGGVARLQAWRLERQVSSFKKELRACEFNLQSIKSQIRSYFVVDPSINLNSKKLDLLQIDKSWVSSFSKNSENVAVNSIENKRFNLRLEEMGPKRWLAYSDSLPHITFDATYGRYRHSGTGYARSLKYPQWEYSGLLSVHIPFLDIPFSILPLSTIVSEEESQIRIDRKKFLDERTEELNLKSMRVLSNLENLDDLQDFLKSLDRELVEDRKAFLLGAIEPTSFAASITSNIQQRIFLKKTIQEINTDYALLALMDSYSTGDSRE